MVRPLSPWEPPFCCHSRLQGTQLHTGPTPPSLGPAVVQSQWDEAVHVPLSPLGAPWGRQAGTVPPVCLLPAPTSLLPRGTLCRADREGGAP